MSCNNSSPESERIDGLERELRRAREDSQRDRRRLEELTGLIDRSSAVVFRWRVQPGVWPVDYVSANVRQFGYMPEDFTSGRVSWPGITHPDDVPRLEAEVAEYTARGRRQFHQVYRILTAAGETRWIDDHTIAVYDDAGHLTHYEGLLLDITERHALEEDLVHREEELRFIVEHTLDALYVLDARTAVVTYVSPVIARWGLQPDTVVGRPFTDFIHPDDLPRVQQDLQRTVATGEAFLTRFRVLAPEGAVTPVEEFGRAILRHGEVVQIIGMLRDITERQQADRILRESEAKFAAFYEFAPVPIATNTLDDARYLEVNAAFERIVGFRREEVLGRTPVELGITCDPVAFAEAARRVLAGEQLRDYAIRFRRKDGEERVGLFAARIVAWGGRQAFLTAVVDITERQQAEEAQRRAYAEVEEQVRERTAELAQANESLRGSEARFRALFEHTAIGIALVDLEEHPMASNPALVRLLGYSAEELRGMRFSEFTHPDDVGIDRTFFQELVANQRKYYQIEKRYLTKDGREIWGLLTASLVRDDAGQPLFAIGMVDDITARKQAEEQVQHLLQATERWAAEMDATIESIADAVIIYTPRLEVARCNRATSVLFGYPHARLEAPLADWLALVRLETPDGDPIPVEGTAAYRAAVLGETVRGQVERFTRANGILRWISASAAPVRTPDGKLLGAVATYADITDLHELQQRQEDLLHIVSHDLRIPLTVIHGHMELLEAGLQQRQLDGEFAFSTGTIDRNIHRLNTMIQDLVDMARLEGRQFALRWEIITLQRYLPDLLARLRNILPVERVTLEIPPDLPPARADADRLERVLLNLLSNAFKYSAEGTPVRVLASRQDQEIVISVTDQGLGIAPEDLPHLFERFYRAGERRAEGAGLGLYITKLLVEAHAVPSPDGQTTTGGRIWVESDVGKGSVFSFTLPVAGEEGKSS